ncbi:hypothetical protein WJ542_11330 [Paraburkholderia sp. B3]|uniref:hypothetical protein n=1 Tax=Paraburkholderia sp. B3 TaxID=3134791 RepID=UPI003982AC47
MCNIETAELVINAAIHATGLGWAVANISWCDPVACVEVSYSDPEKLPVLFQALSKAVETMDEYGMEIPVIQLKHQTA